MKNVTSITSYYTCLTLLFSILSFHMSAQENGIFELNSNSTTIVTNKSNSELSLTKSSKSTIDSRSDFNNLAYNLHTIVFIENGIEKLTYGDGTIIKMTLEDAISVNNLNTLLSKYKDIQLLTIKLKSKNETINQLDLNSISSISSLKYIFLKCSFDCDETLLNQFINNNSNIRVFYLCAESE